VDSELFGHERGSFTGAEAQRKAGSSAPTADAASSTRSASCRSRRRSGCCAILQDGTLRARRRSAPLHVDVRIVAATHRDLGAMVAERRFREDLWYRIAVFPIQLPPLRDRREDIPALATHFALRAATRFGTPPRLPSPEEMELLLEYPWPGNVRELTAVIGARGDPRERAHARRRGVARSGMARALRAGRGRHHAVPPHRRMARRRHRRRARSRRSTSPSGVTSRKRSPDARRIEGARGAAALLDINPHTLRAKMRKLHIDWARFRED
jgi:transcriptional regulator with GAF, ATPase, and Fis domain